MCILSAFVVAFIPLDCPGIPSCCLVLELASNSTLIPCYPQPTNCACNFCVKTREFFRLDSRLGKGKLGKKTWRDPSISTAAKVSISGSTSSWSRVSRDDWSSASGNEVSGWYQCSSDCELLAHLPLATPVFWSNPFHKYRPDG